MLASAAEDLHVERLEQQAPKFIFFVHWSWIIPHEIHTLFPCIVFHMTDLPYGRGGSPLQNLIISGHKDTMITALKCIDEIDAGPVYLKKYLSLSGSAEEILVRASNVIAEMIGEIIMENPDPKNQSGKATLFSRRRPQDGNMEELEAVTEVYDYIRMLDAEGYPRAYLDIGHFRLEFSAAKMSERGDEVEALVRIRRKSDVT